MVQFFKGNGDVMNYSCYRVVKLPEHGMKVVEMLLEKGLHKIVFVNEMQFSFMLEKGTIDAVFILQRLQEEYHVKETDRQTPLFEVW